ncbi:MAG: DNA polymerase III subunit epsilon, partial [Pseudomonadota bacterium]
YLELIGGRQPDFALSVRDASAKGPEAESWTPPHRPNTLKSRLTSSEKSAHDQFIKKLGDQVLWRT